VVEEARAAGMAPDNPRLQAAERNLAIRYAEVKEMAAMADKLGIGYEEAAEADADEELDARYALSQGQQQDPAMLQARAQQAAAAEQAAAETVGRLQLELENCVQQLRMIDGSTSESVSRHPAFRRMRGSVQQKMEALHAQLTEARAAHEYEAQQSRVALAALERSIEGAEESQQEEMDLTPLLKDSLDNLWSRPYDCRVFTLQLLQAMAELDDRSVCMMASCFARYIETHSAPASEKN